MRFLGIINDLNSKEYKKKRINEIILKIKKNYPDAIIIESDKRKGDEFIDDLQQNTEFMKFINF